MCITVVFMYVLIFSIRIKYYNTREAVHALWTMRNFTPVAIWFINIIIRVMKLYWIVRLVPYYRLPHQGSCLYACLIQNIWRKVSMEKTRVYTCTWLFVVETGFFFTYIMIFSTVGVQCTYSSIYLKRGGPVKLVFSIYVQAIEIFLWFTYKV